MDNALRHAAQTTTTHRSADGKKTVCCIVFHKFYPTKVIDFD